MLCLIVKKSGLFFKFVYRQYIRNRMLTTKINYSLSGLKIHTSFSECQRIANPSERRKNDSPPNKLLLVAVIYQ